MRKTPTLIRNRQSVRLKEFDYGQIGSYFITICSHEKKQLFGTIADKKMILNPLGQIVRDEWEKLPERWPHISLGVFQVMPNHLHGILIFQAIEKLDSHTDTKKQWAERPTLSQVIGAYCSISANNCVDFIKENQPDFHLGKVWQRGFHDHIIRTEKSFNYISDYIVTNPENWEKDCFFL